MQWIALVTSIYLRRARARSQTPRLELEPMKGLPTPASTVQPTTEGSRNQLRTAAWRRVFQRN